MCTATWLREGAGYRVLFNRDEARSRSEASPPELRRRHGVRYIAPHDGDAGGTWLAVNELGLTVGLLNLYRASVAEDGDYVSRGELVAEMASSVAVDELERRLSSTDLARFRPFTLFGIDPSTKLRAWEWDGRALTPRAESDRFPLTSSALEDRAAGRARRELMERYRDEGPLTAERLLEFHRSHRPERGPLSPCMHRPEAATVSLSLVEVAAASVRMHYAAGPACTAPLVPGPEIARSG
jgi:hypothetical protein